MSRQKRNNKTRIQVPAELRWTTGRGSDDIYLDAWQAIVLQQARLAVDADKRGSTGAARFVGTATELMPDARPLEHDTQLPAMQLNISTDALLALADRLGALPDGEVVRVGPEIEADAS